MRKIVNLTLKRKTGKLVTANRKSIEFDATALGVGQRFETNIDDRQVRAKVTQVSPPLPAPDNLPGLVSNVSAEEI